eukprot:5753318-Alexandrium_andersonii.AAC.1
MKSRKQNTAQCHSEPSRYDTVAPRSRRRCSKPTKRHTGPLVGEAARRAPSAPEPRSVNMLHCGSDLAKAAASLSYRSARRRSGAK